MPATPPVEPTGPADRTAALLAITAVAIGLFVGIGSTVLGGVLRSARGEDVPIDPSLMIALILNIALILLGWRKHRELVEASAGRRAAEARAQTLASNDPLTGLMNRRSFVEAVWALLRRDGRRESAVAMLAIDIDGFRRLTDRQGTASGDALLTAMSAILRETLPPAAAVARLADDRFAAALAFDPGFPTAVDRLVERIAARLAGDHAGEGATPGATVSIGIARSDHDCAATEPLMRAAEMALDAARKDGGNRAIWFDRAMEQALRVRTAIETGLRTAIPNEAIEPYFERQIDLATGQLIGFEVLARWNHPAQGLLLPDQFIPIAEDTGLIGDLSLSLLRQAARAARDWEPSLRLAINISPRQLSDPWLAQKIIKVLTETNFPPARLEIEVTEGALFDNPALARSIIGSLKNQGIAIALDDFGTGYSSLAHLRVLPFDRIKIDRSFVGSLECDAESAAIVTAIAGLGETLNLPITAEGVESETVARRVAAMGCRAAQGYLYGAPLSLGETRRLLEREGRLAPVAAPLTSRRLAG